MVFCHCGNIVWEQEPITRSRHKRCTLESTLSSKELFLEQASPSKVKCFMTPLNFSARYPSLLSKVLQNTKEVLVNEHD